MAHLDGMPGPDDGSEKDGSEKSGSRLVFGVLESENPMRHAMRHAGRKYWKKVEASLTSANLLVVANGGHHPECGTIIETELSEFPDLPVSHRVIRIIRSAKSSAIRSRARTCLYEP